MTSFGDVVPGVTRSEQLRVALVQLTSVDDLDRNLASCLSALASIATSGSCDLICLPENALYFRGLETDPLPALDLSDRHIARLAEAAREMACAVHVGSVPLLEDGRVFSASVLIQADGSVSGAYRKIHLFDVDVRGMKRVRESDSFAAGSRPVILEVAGWRLGSSICYDLRFAELYATYAKTGVDALLVPSAFLVATGRRHWDVLLRARAIESQAFVLAAAQGGRHRGRSGGERETWGHSMIVGPWGEKMAECEDGDGSADFQTVRATLTKSMLKDVRDQIPMARHRRL